MRKLISCLAWVSAFGIVFALLIAPSTLQAAEMPEGWPWHGVSIGFPEGDPADIERYKQELGIDAVRLQLKLRKYAKRRHLTKEQAWDDGIAWVNRMLDCCSSQDVRAIINISAFPLDPDEDMTQTQAGFWKEKSNLDGVITVAARLAFEFRTRGKELAGYDVMSEPVIVEGGVSRRPEAWPSLLRRIVSTIREHDSHRWIVIVPGPWGGPNGYNDFEPVADSRMIYGVHVYKPHRFTHQGIRDISMGEIYPGMVGFRLWNKERLEQALAPLRRFQQQHDVPVLVGEFSAVRWAKGGEQYIKDLSAIFDDYGWSWLYFSATGWHGWNPDYNQHYPGRRTDASEDFLGDQSIRWQTLRDIFGMKKGTVKP